MCRTHQRRYPRSDASSGSSVWKGGSSRHPKTQCPTSSTPRSDSLIRALWGRSRMLRFVATTTCETVAIHPMAHIHLDMTCGRGQPRCVPTTTSFINAVGSPYGIWQWDCRRHVYPHVGHRKMMLDLGWPTQVSSGGTGGRAATFRPRQPPLISDLHCLAAPHMGHQIPPTWAVSLRRRHPQIERQQLDFIPARGATVHRDVA